MTNFTIDDIGNSVLDSRDIQERIDELNDEKDTFIDAHIEDALDDHKIDNDNSEEGFDKTAAESTAIEAWGNSDEGSELKKLEDLKEEVGSSEWPHGLTLICDSHWMGYVQDMLEDCSDYSKNLPHYIAINWNETADNIKADYSEVEIDGTTYFYRNC